MQTSFDENLGIVGPEGQDGANRWGRALGARPPHPRTRPDTTPLPYPNGHNPGKIDVCLKSCAGLALRCTVIKAHLDLWPKSDLFITLLAPQL